MKIAGTHRKGVTSALVLAMATFLPGPVQGEVATAQIIADAVPPAVDTQIAPAPAVPAEAAPEMAKPEKVLEQDEEDRAVILAEGMASYYGAELAGNRTANGERFDPDAMTAAHRTLPMGTKLKVTNKANGKSVIVRINDRGPFAKKRIIDISRGAAERISMIRSGTARVTLEIVS